MGRLPEIVIMLQLNQISGEPCPIDSLILIDISDVTPAFSRNTPSAPNFCILLLTRNLRIESERPQ